MIIKTYEFACLIPRDEYYITQCCQGEQGLRKKGKGGGCKEKSILEREEGTIDVKRGREEIWKGIREREQLIRRESSGMEREKEREGLGQGGTAEGKRQVVALG